MVFGCLLLLLAAAGIGYHLYSEAQNDKAQRRADEARQKDLDGKMASLRKGQRSQVDLLKKLRKMEEDVMVASARKDPEPVKPPRAVKPHRSGSKGHASSRTKKQREEPRCNPTDPLCGMYGKRR